MFENVVVWEAGGSAEALPVDLVFIFLVVLSVATTLAIFAVIAVFSFKYRRRHGREATPIHGSLILEIGWSVVPMGIFLVIFVWGAVIFFDARTPPQDATEIYVVANQ